MIVTNQLTLAKKLDNYEIYTGVADVYWVDSTHYRATVPANKRWFLYGGAINRDASQTLNVTVFNSADKTQILLAAYTAGTGTHPYPIEAYVGKIVMPIPMDAGEYVEALFGGAQSTAAFGSCIVLEVDM